MIKFLKQYGGNIFTGVLIVLAAAFGADCAFAMAIDPVQTMETAETMAERPEGEKPQTDEQGGKTQMQGHAATATDVRDAGLEAEDYDKTVDEFRRFRFPIETYIANRCRPVKSESYVHSHFRSGSTNLDAIYSGAEIAITAGQDSSISIDSTSTKVFTKKDNILILPSSLFDNPDCMIRCSTVLVQGADGFAKDADGLEVTSGDLMLYVLDNDKTNQKIKFLVINPPFNTSGTASKTTIPEGAVFATCATAGSESQIRVDSETYLPEKSDELLQKKIMTMIITDEYANQNKKVNLGVQNALAAAMYNFKRKCARSHWVGEGKRIDVYVPETGQREATYLEKGILRQIPMLYTHGEELTDDDLLAISSLQFTDNASNDYATVFCGKKWMKRLLKLANSSDKYRDITKVEVNEFGIKVRYWKDNFGTLEFVYDPTLGDIGYDDYAVVVDLDNAVRYYKVNDKEINQDMKKSGESREAMAYNKYRTDCVCLKGYNAILVCPASKAAGASRLGGIQADIVSVSVLPSGAELTADAKTKKYYLTAETSEFPQGTIVEWDNEIGGWIEFEGVIKA